MKPDKFNTIIQIFYTKYRALYKSKKSWIGSKYTFVDIYNNEYHYKLDGEYKLSIIITKYRDILYRSQSAFYTRAQLLDALSKSTIVAPETRRINNIRLILNK